MKYYKLLKNNEFIGAISSNNFVTYSPIAGCFLRSDETKGEYISYNGQLYRSEWMAPIVKQKRFTSVDISEITEEEYNIFQKAIEKNETIVIEEEEEEEIPVLTEEEISIEVNWMRQNKVSQMSKTCRKTIEEGFDMKIRGETKHFSLSTQDQLNLMSLAQMAQTQSMLPYHADGEEVVFYAAEEIQELVDEMNAFKIYHTTYYNALKAYINSLSTIEELDAVEYGMEIPDEFKTDVLKALE